MFLLFLLSSMYCFKLFQAKGEGAVGPPEEASRGGDRSPQEGDRSPPTGDRATQRENKKAKT